MSSNSGSVLENAGHVNEGAPDTGAKIDSLQNTVNSLTQTVSHLSEMTRAALERHPSVVYTQPTVEEETNIDPELEKSISAIVDRKVSSTRKEINRDLEIKTLQQKWDERADKEFAFVLDPTHVKFKPEYRDMVKREMSTLSDTKAPDSVYNACARVAAKILAQSNAQIINNSARVANVREGYLDGGNSGGGQINQNQDLSEEQKYLASRIGISEDKYKQVHGPARRKGAR